LQLSVTSTRSDSLWSAVSFMTTVVMALSSFRNALELFQSRNETT
jgi:hypothetical protein